MKIITKFIRNNFSNIMLLLIFLTLAMISSTQLDSIVSLEYSIEDKLESIETRLESIESDVDSIQFDVDSIKFDVGSM